MDGFTQLAKLFKERENPKPYCIEIGKVMTPPPDIKISLGSQRKIILTKENLLFASHMLKDYKREFSIEGDISFITSNCGLTNEKNVGDHGAHKHTIESLNVNTNQKSKGKITLTDTLKTGDEVILLPNSDGQSYYVVDKVVRL